MMDEQETRTPGQGDRRTSAATDRAGAASRRAESEASWTGETLTVRLPETTYARRETGILAGAVTAVPILVAAGIGVIPQLKGLWPTALGVSVLVVVSAVVLVLIWRSARWLLIGQGTDTQIVAYRDDRETGKLYKGKIENVALRVSTIHRIVDGLTTAIPTADRQQALYRCGAQVGADWVSDFQEQLLELEIEPDDKLHQILKWSDYDATAGMGRLNIAVDPQSGVGVVALANGFLSRAPAVAPLNWWFAGYLAGSLEGILGRKLAVRLADPTSAISSTTFFDVLPELPATSLASVGHPPHPASMARGKIWWRKLRRPLPEEEQTPET